MSRRRTTRVIVQLGGALIAMVAGTFIMLTVRDFSSRGGSPAPSREDHDVKKSRPPRPKPKVAASPATQFGDPAFVGEGGWVSVLDAATLVPVTSATAYFTEGEGRRIVPMEFGAFRLPRAEPTPAPGRLSVEAPGYFPSAAQVSALPPDGGRIFLVPHEPITIRCVSAESLEPISGVEVHARVGFMKEASAITDDAGEADLKGLVMEIAKSSMEDGEPPEYAVDLTASTDGFLARSAKLVVVPGETWGTLQILLEPARSFRLRVVDKDSRLPLPGASVLHQWDYRQIENVNRERRVFSTSKDGEVLLSVREGAHRLQVLAAHEEYATLGLEVENIATLATPTSTEPGLLLALERGHDVEGIVVTADGKPVPNVIVDLDPVSGPDFTDWMRFAAQASLSQVPDMTHTDADGRFTFRRLQAGDYQVLLGHPEYCADPESPKLQVGPEAEPWIGILRAGIELAGTVVDEAGAPIERAAVVLARLGDDGKIIKSGPSKLFRTVRTTKVGHFRAHGLIPARYTATFSAGAGYEVAADTVDAHAPPPAWTIALRKKPQRPEAGAGTVWLRFVTGEDRRLDGLARVDFYAIEDKAFAYSLSERLQSGELYRIGVPLGTFHLVARLQGYAPAVLPSVRLEMAPGRAANVRLAAGSIAVIEVLTGPHAGSLAVTDSRLTLKIAEEWLRASPAIQRLSFRLEPGIYRASFLVEGSPVAEGSFCIAATANHHHPLLHLEAPERKSKDSD